MGRAFTRVLVFLIIVGLTAAVVALLSRLNERTFTLQTVDDNLVVMKGRPFPVGEQPYHPSDALQRDAYAPIPLNHAGADGLLEQRFTEKEELDRALFDLISRLASTRITSEDPKVLDQGLYYLHRSEMLSGLTDGQRTLLKGMQSEVAFYLARSSLDDARRMVAQALSQLKLASGIPNRHARTASQMLLEVEPAATALEEALRRAVHQLSAPAEPDAK